MTYPKEVYSIGIDHVKQEIVLRTTNKKYYKRFDIPDMRRIGLNLEDIYLQWKYQNNTVIIGYEKPDKILELEAIKKKEVQSLGLDSFAGQGSSTAVAPQKTAAAIKTKPDEQCKQQ